MSTHGASKRDSKRPVDTPFNQQTLKAWRPILTPRLVILLFCCIGLIFIPVGIWIIAISDTVVEVESTDYSASCCIANCDNTSSFLRIDRNPCEVNISVKAAMEQPIYLYYKLTNYFQNHRRYVKSRDDIQLRGLDTSTEMELQASCGDNHHVLAGDSGLASSIISPCGLVAWSVFNDSFSLRHSDAWENGGVSSGAYISLNESNIAWASDRDQKFRNSENGTTGQNFPPFAYQRNRTCTDLPANKMQDCLNSTATPEAGWCYPGSGYCVEDEHFIVWMRSAGLPSFRKLWGTVNEPLMPGNYTVTVTNGVLSDGSYLNPSTEAEQTFLYPVSTFGGTKSLVLSTVSSIGGRNYFLGYAYLLVGVVCLVLALCFFIKHRMAPRELGTAPYVTWQKGVGKAS